ncbi:biotin-dependent carboxyltransferase family protein [Winogradskyella sp. 3972H.M.0a.05]|uniref:5-oxoprolinase subunit C family protein n=1 Tax=Winogradskyella sp. 3972H.M.0a.05 TaxID=2950277 RepID=UPI0033967257
MIEVLHSGLYTSIQDQGRFGFQEFGVPSSGAMDQYSADLANLLLGNDTNDAVLEMTIQGPKLKFHSDTQIAITGAEMSPSLNDKPIAVHQRIAINTGDVLSFGALKQGCRTYLAVKGGFQSSVMLNSRSMYSGITETKMLKRGDTIPIESLTSETSTNKASIKANINHLSDSELSVFKGPEFDSLDETTIKVLTTTEFSVSNSSNRMAYLFNEVLPNDLPQIITAPSLPGTVQLTPSGQLIVLAKDCQTTGGYPRILQLSQEAMHCLFQKKAQQKVQLKIVDNPV